MGLSLKNSSSLKIAIIVALIVIIFLAVAFPATSSPRFCGLCHEMQSNYRSWQRSVHHDVNCITCHAKPGFINLVVDKFSSLGDVYSHFTTNSSELVINEDGLLSKDIPSKNCLLCHKSFKDKSDNGRIKYDHKTHEKAGFTCAYCHNRVAHPGFIEHKERITMPFCLDCHRKKNAALSCSTCHPAGFKLKPASHEQSNWIKAHGHINDVSSCLLCHNKSSCDNCHGAPLPHPEGWRQTHKTWAEKNKDKCLLCHKVSGCDNCHRTVNPHQPDWISSHNEEVEKNGNAKCLNCHTIDFCDSCHAQFKH